MHHKPWTKGLWIPQQASHMSCLHSYPCATHDTSMVYHAPPNCQHMHNCTHATKTGTTLHAVHGTTLHAAHGTTLHAVHGTTHAACGYICPECAQDDRTPTLEALEKLCLPWQAMRMHHAYAHAWNHLAAGWPMHQAHAPCIRTCTEPVGCWVAHAPCTRPMHHAYAHAWNQLAAGWPMHHAYAHAWNQLAAGWPCASLHVN